MHVKQTKDLMTLEKLWSIKMLPDKKLPKLKNTLRWLLVEHAI